MNIPRPEHPNPQWERKEWRNLNGEWEFDFDFGASARNRELYKGGSLPRKITVPFCPESTLSGIGYTDFIAAVCYRKAFTLTEEELEKNVFMHFGAVDFHSYIYINGELAGEHIGGYSSFKVDITSFVKAGENIVFVIAEDDTRSPEQAAGKQSGRYESYGCFYTRTTGIWQTVWLEFVPKNYVKGCKFYSDIKNGCITITGEAAGSGELELSAFYEGELMGETTVKVSGGCFTAQLALKEVHLWEEGCGRLYDLNIRFGEDNIKSYFGMREFRIEGNKILFNGKPFFMRMVLDQGYYPDGIYTAKNDEALKNDILLSKALGFTGARLHQKVFEKRFIYHCDKEGYMIWGEHASWGLEAKDAVAQDNYICEWLEIMERDFNSPALIGWCPFNETWGYNEKNTKFRTLETVYKITKQCDPTRPCIETSGNYHLDKKEIHDLHNYEQDTKVFAEDHSRIDEGIIVDTIVKRDKLEQPYFGEPIFISEYGGIRWSADESGWGYGNAPKNLDEFVERYCSLADTLISNPYISGLCYTQLYDIEQEQNGIYNYDRTPKFDEETMAKLKAAMTKAAKIEEL